MFTWIKIILVVSPVYAASAALSQWSYADPRPPGRVVVQMMPSFVPAGQSMFRTTELTFFPGEIAGLTELGDSAVIYEENKSLGPANRTVSEDVLRNGWQGPQFIFSTSDHSDPRTNGRRYWVVIP
jgi:hypothetical protein